VSSGLLADEDAADDGGRLGGRTFAGGGRTMVATSLTNKPSRLAAMMPRGGIKSTAEATAGTDASAAHADGEPVGQGELMNARALEVITRVQAKLTGRDFFSTDDLTSDEVDDLTVEQQVERLISEATSVENLCQMYQGWCPLW
jgi:FKBP12-rapamycin complex-associated protein